MKKILFILITFFTIFNVNALELKERTDNNLGINKNIKITDDIKEEILKTKYVDSNEKVYDFAEVLNENEIKNLKEKANKFINKSDIDLVLVTINEDIDKDEVKKFSRNFYNYNDFGLKTKEYDGIEIIINVNSSNKFLYIISFGDSIYIKQDDLQKILDGVYNSINSKDYNKGFNEFIDLTDKIYEENKNGNNLYFNDILTSSKSFDIDKIKQIRSSKENYGVNKPAKFTKESENDMLKTPLVDSSLKVYDFSGVLTEEENNDLQTKAKTFLEETGIELIIVTINEQWSDSSIEEFADNFFDFNDFGISETSKSYDGILVVRNTNNFNRYYYISTSGLGQMYFPSSRVDDILDDMYDNMHSDEYYEAFKDFIYSAKSNYKKGVPSKYKDCTVDQMGDLYDKNGKLISWEKGVYVMPIIPALIISTVVSLIVILIMISKNKMVKKAVTANDYLDKDSIKYTKKQDNFVSTHTSSYRISSSSGGGGSHHSSGGFSHGGGGRHC